MGVRGVSASVVRRERLLRSAGVETIPFYVEWEDAVSLTLDLSTYFPNFTMAVSHWLRVANSSDGLRFALFGTAAPAAFAASSAPGLSQAIDYYAWTSDGIYTLGGDGSNGQIRMTFGPWLRTFRRRVVVPDDLPIRESFATVANFATYLGDIGTGMQGSIPVYGPAGQVIRQYNVTTDWQVVPGVPGACAHIYGKAEWYDAPTFARVAFEEFWLSDDVPVLDNTGALVSTARGLRAFRHVDILNGVEPPVPIAHFVWEPLSMLVTRSGGTPLRPMRYYRGYT